MANILILGGGFGGIRTALDLGKKVGKEHTVTLIDKNDFHLFLPSLYEVASARGVEQEDMYKVELKGTVSVPYGDIFHKKHANFVQAKVTHIDTRNQEVHIGSGKVLNYDYLVLAFGSETATLGIPGVREYAHQFKSINDGLFIHTQIHNIYKEAAEGRKELPIKFLIVGAGFTGIELAAELACCGEKIRKICNIEKGCTHIALFEATPQILPMVSEKERNIIRKRLKKLDVSIYTNSPVESIISNKIKLENGNSIYGDIIVWTAGIKASSFISNIVGLHTDGRGRVLVNQYLQSKDHPNIFTIGDNAGFIDPATEKNIPALAYVAIDQGSIAAKNIMRHIDNRELKPYKAKYEAWIAPVGGKYAVAHINKHLTIVGFFGWIIREIVDLRYFLKTLSFKKALSAFFRGVMIFVKND